jgi:hypothetical protein
MDGRALMPGEEICEEKGTAFKACCDTPDSAQPAQVCGEPFLFSDPPITRSPGSPTCAVFACRGWDHARLPDLFLRNSHILQGLSSLHIFILL